MKRKREREEKLSCIDMCVMKFYLLVRQTVRILIHTNVYRDEPTDTHAHTYGQKNMNHSQCLPNNIL